MCREKWISVLTSTSIVLILFIYPHFSIGFLGNHASRAHWVRVIPVAQIEPAAQFPVSSYTVEVQRRPASELHH